MLDIFWAVIAEQLKELRTAKNIYRGERHGKAPEQTGQSGRPAN
ncbi:hypothetical protein [Streptomyces sp. NPDC002215]